MTSNGELIRPLVDVRLEGDIQRAWVYASSVDQALLIEKTADFGDDDFPSWDKAVSKRIREARRKH